VNHRLTQTQNCRSPLRRHGCRCLHCSTSNRCRRHRFAATNRALGPEPPTWPRRKSEAPRPPTNPGQEQSGRDQRLSTAKLGRPFCAPTAGAADRILLPSPSRGRGRDRASGELVDLAAEGLIRHLVGPVHRRRHSHGTAESPFRFMDYDRALGAWSRSRSGAQARGLSAGLAPLVAETPHLRCRVRPWRA
jgi:hypothetical protein